MKKRFAYELGVGIILLAAVLFFGTKGMLAIVLLALQPFIGKKTADERENQLFYRVGNYTAGITLVASVIIFECSDMILNGLIIGKNWLGMVIASFLIAHGAMGLIIFKTNE
jgi:hypothetical protein